MNVSYVRLLSLSTCIMLLLVLGEKRVAGQAGASGVGAFENHSDVGAVLQAGSASYDASTKSYTIAGSGENMWFAADAFQFVWTRNSGDVSLAADVSFIGKGGNPHRKAVLMMRQSLDADSAYADIALHGDGLTSLQFRDEKGETTHEIQSNLSAPGELRLEKRGEYFYMSLAPKNGVLQIAGGSVRIPVRGTFYVGIGVCSHDKGVIEKAVFTNVSVRVPLPAVAAQPALYSTLETVTIASTDRRVVYVAPGRFEAPNWMPDGKSLLFNRNGRIERLALAGGKPEIIDTGFANRCNNDHGISPDGTLLAISDQSQEDHRSLVYIVPIGGGAPRRITQRAPSYWHGWSPDGKTLAFVGERDGNFDIYSIPLGGGEETRLTTAKGLDDGPEYSPDGRYIYFNSERTGTMQIWRMRPDGSEQEQITADEFNNWFPHISPDGKWMVFLSYEKNVTGHPENKDVMLRFMSLSDKKISVLAKLFGGQGTINVPSWSPDSRQLAFVSYQLSSEEIASPAK
jgi:TolB protein